MTYFRFLQNLFSEVKWFYSSKKYREKTYLSNFVCEKCCTVQLCGRGSKKVWHNPMIHPDEREDQSFLTKPPNFNNTCIEESAFHQPFQAGELEASSCWEGNSSAGSHLCSLHSFLACCIRSQG